MQDYSAGEKEKTTLFLYFFLCINVDYTKCLFPIFIMTSFNFTFFGSGYSIPHSNRHNTSLFIQSETTDVLIDSNGICGQQLSRLKIKLSKIKHIFLTHRHMDHIGALPNLVAQIWLQSVHYADKASQRTEPLHIYANQETIAIVQKLFDVMDVLAASNMFEIVFHELDDNGGALQIGDINFEYFPVQHGATPCLGFVASYGGRRLVYSADTEPCDTIYSRLQEGDVLIHESNFVNQDICPAHTTWLQIKAMLPDWPKIKTYLVHLPEMANDVEQAFLKDLESCGYDVFEAEDGQTITL